MVSQDFVITNADRMNFCLLGRCINCMRVEMINKRLKRALERKQKARAANYFSKVAVLNDLIDKGGEAAKDAASIKINRQKGQTIFDKSVKRASVRASKYSKGA